MANGQQPPAQQPPPRSSGVAGTAAAATAGPAAGDVAGAAAAAKIGPAIPSSVARASAEAAIIGALVAYLARKRAADAEFLRRQIALRSPDVQPSDVQQIIADEQARDEAFALKQAERISTELRRILTLPDPAEREAEIQKMLDRERRYTEQRAEAMAARAIAAADREALRISSPQGAFWLLGIAKEHTSGCLAMHNRFWPWAVLDRIHPPRHPGCTSYLIGYGEAVSMGLMKPSDVPSEHDAIARAANVVMEFDAEAGRELAAITTNLGTNGAGLREALIAAGLTTAERFDEAVGGSS